MPERMPFIIPGYFGQIFEIPGRHAAAAKNVVVKRRGRKKVTSTRIYIYRTSRVKVIASWAQQCTRRRKLASFLALIGHSRQFYAVEVFAVRQNTFLVI
jgi:hypothetical protein